MKDRPRGKKKVFSPVWHQPGKLRAERIAPAWFAGLWQGPPCQQHAPGDHQLWKIKFVSFLKSFLPKPPWQDFNHCHHLTHSNPVLSLICLKRPETKLDPSAFGLSALKLASLPSPVKWCFVNGSGAMFLPSARILVTISEASGGKELFPGSSPRPLMSGFGGFAPWKDSCCRFCLRTVLLLRLLLSICFSFTQTQNIIQLNPSCLCNTCAPMWRKLF